MFLSIEVTVLQTVERAECKAALLARIRENMTEFMTV